MEMEKEIINEEPREFIHEEEFERERIERRERRPQREARPPRRRVKQKKRGFLSLGKSIGIDLGTANTLVYHKQKEQIVLNEPSVVAVDRDSRKVVAVGKEAKDMLGKTPDDIIAVRPLSEGVIADYDITAAMIKYFIKKVFGRSITSPEIMICVPIEVTGVEKRAVMEAAISAGAKRAFLIEEARAAALGSGIDISAPEGNMIVDIGGGSTDIAVISLGGTVVSRSIKTAGNNFDSDIIRYIKRKHNLLIGDRTAEQIKMNIGTALPLDERLEMTIKGRDLVSGLPKPVTINSDEVLEAINDSLHEIVTSVKQVLEKTPPELAADIVDTGIVMAGGGSLIKNFPQLISQNTQLPVRVADNTLEAVVVGAGLALDMRHVLKQIDRAER